MPAGRTEQVTLTVPAGCVRASVNYLYREGDALQVRGVEASFTSASGYALPHFTFAFYNPAMGATDYQFSTPPVNANAARSHDTGPIMLGSRQGIRRAHRGDVLDITLNAADPQNGPWGALEVLEDGVPVTEAARRYGVARPS